MDMTEAFFAGVPEGMLSDEEVEMHEGYDNCLIIRREVLRAFQG